VAGSPHTAWFEAVEVHSAVRGLASRVSATFEPGSFAEIRGARVRLGPAPRRPSPLYHAAARVL